MSTLKCHVAFMLQLKGKNGGFGDKLLGCKLGESLSAILDDEDE